MTNEAITAPAHLATGRTRQILTAGAFFTFFVFGFVDNLKGPTLPALLRDLDFSYSRGGTMLLGAYFGFLVATLVTGVLADRLGNKRILFAAGVLLTVGIGLFSRSSTFGTLTLAMSITGLGLGAIEVGGNSLIVELYSTRRARFLNLLAVFHGIGSLVVPLYAAQLLLRDFSWRQVYSFALVLTVALALFFLFVRYPRAAGAGTGGLNLTAVRAAGFTPRMLWYYLLIVVYVGAELGIAAWIVEFMQQVKGMAVGPSSLYLSLFFAAIMVGRLVGSVLVDRVGHLRIMLLAAVGSVLFLAVGIYGPPVLAVFVPLTGIFFSIVFPTTTAAVSEEHPVNTGAILGILFAAGGLGGALGPWLIGVANDLVGVQNGFALSILYCVIMAVALLALRRDGESATR
ncbi:MAG: MFS transporter [Caldilineaceae bacterium]|nr:MFS transporter [Caldilineaceae bacterium]